MAIEKQFTKTVSTNRLTNVSGSFKETWQENVASVLCAIQPQSPEHSQTLDGASYKLYKMWCAFGEDILTSDQVIDGDDTYQVRSVSVKNYGSKDMKHLVVMLSLGE